MSLIMDVRYRNTWKYIGHDTSVSEEA